MNAVLKPEIPAIPEGWIMNSLGHLEPITAANQHRVEEGKFVEELYAKAETISKALEAFAKAAHDDVDAFRQLTMERYGLSKISPTGYAELRSFDGKTVVHLSIGKKLTFGAEADAAKPLFDKCMVKWSAGVNAHAKAMIEHAFRKDRKSQLNADKLWELTQIKVEGDEKDADWDAAIQALKDAARWVSTRPYIRFHKQEGREKPDLLKLSFTDF